MRKMFSENQIRKIAGAVNEEVIELELGEDPQEITLEESRFYKVNFMEGASSGVLKSPQLLGVIGNTDEETDAFGGIVYNKSDRFITFIKSNIYFFFSKGIIELIRVEI